MRNSVRMELAGLAELDEALLDLGKATARNVLRRAGKIAMEPVAAAGKALAPEVDGDLKKSVIVSDKLNKYQRKLLRKNTQFFAEVHAGPKWPEGAHGHLVEFGTNDRQYTTKAGAVVYTGSTAPNPFMRPAWDYAKSGVAESLRRQIAAEIEKAQQRAARKAARIAKKAAK